MRAFPIGRKTFVAGLLVVLIGRAAGAGDYFVSPTGSDANPGTRDMPLATLERARDAARGAKKAPTTIHLMAGTHYLPETLVLGPDDSGTAEAPVTFAAVSGGGAVISGGSKLNLKWQPFRDGILKASVPPGFTTDQLFVNGESQSLARYPNYDAKAQYYNGFVGDVLSPQRVARWADPQGGFLHAMHAGHWGGFHFRFTGKNADGQVRYEGGWQNNRQSGMNEGIRFVENIFEELDAPGEWFHDAQHNLLYFWPPEGLDLDKATIESVRLRHLVELRGDARNPVRFVRFEGLKFRHAARTFMDTREPLLRSDWTMYRGGAVLFAGTEDCSLQDCLLDQLAGNAVFVSNYNRRATIRGCHITNAGGSGVAFVGDPGAVRNPLFEYGQRQNVRDLDKTPGPRGDNYPADCLVDDCLIHLSGRIEKQTAGVQISMAQGITVRHCSIYDVPRAGINIGDGCWGDHVIEFCDAFDTVKETGDHGSFNSWGRDRYWNLEGADANTFTPGDSPNLPRLDALKPTILRNNRWRCDHGWDIDLDDGSSNYEIRNNLCLNGGLKNREGFYRVVENNIIVNNSFHPHVWYKNSEDIFRCNIVGGVYQPIGVNKPWGKQVDYNLLHQAGQAPPRPATALQAQSGSDEHSLVADALFVDPDQGDYRVKPGSPALALGFQNFPMAQFGVQKPELRSIARTPRLPGSTPTAPAGPISDRSQRTVSWLGATIKNVVGLGEISATGLTREAGVRIAELTAESRASQAGLKANDVILKCDDKPTDSVADLFNACSDVLGPTPIKLEIWRDQKSRILELKLSEADQRGPLSQALLKQPTPEVKMLCETRADHDFQRIGQVGSASLAHARAVQIDPGTNNERPQVLTDGQINDNYGPVFANGVTDGKYKVDLGKMVDIGQVNTYSFNQNGNRGHQKFTLYGSASADDPGWRVDDAARFTAVAQVDSSSANAGQYEATSLRRSSGSMGRYRWLIWAAKPVNGVENTAFQEFEVLAAERN